MKEECIHGKKLIYLGVLVFIAGLLRYYGFDWSIVLMVAGALLFLKGLIVKFVKK